MHCRRCGTVAQGKSISSGSRTDTFKAQPGYRRGRGWGGGHGGAGGWEGFATLICLGPDLQALAACNPGFMCMLICLCCKLLGHPMLCLPAMQQQECSNLMEVVRELTDSRSRLVCAKTNLAEQLAELRHDYMRVARVADLSRTVSKENVAKAAKAQKEPASGEQANDARGQGLHMGDVSHGCMVAEVAATICG